MLAAPGQATAAVWSNPFRIATAGSTDLLPPQLGLSATGAAVVGSGTFDEDAPSQSAAFAALAPDGGAFAPARPVPGSQQVLGAAFAGSTADLLTGTSRRGLSCCSTADIVQLSAAGRYGGRRAIVGNLSGATVGQLVALPHAVLAVIATGLGVWVSQADKGGRFGASRQLAAAGTAPTSMAATTLGASGTAVAWAIAPPAIYPDDVPASVYYATGSQTRAPSRAAVAVTLPVGYDVDSVAIAGDGSRPTVAWVASWYDAQGVYHSEVFATDAGSSAPPAELSSANDLASSVSIASDPRGDQVIAWRDCGAAGACGAFASLRYPHGQWSPPTTLGSLDPTVEPVAVESTAGTALVAWIADGDVYTSLAAPGALRFKPSREISRSDYDTDVTAAFAPDGAALAVWIQGTEHESLYGARLGRQSGARRSPATRRLAG
jgi:hypothetical protein